jgi:glutamate dehydrogenase (NAD(P)+)
MANDDIRFDDFGPERILEVYDPKIGMKGFVVIHNTALGPGKGGIRMTTSVSPTEVYRLAETMTWKTAIADLPFGGAKGGLVVPAGTDLKKKEQLVRAYSDAMKIVSPSMWVAAPDINSGEQEMRWFAEANGSMKSCTGKPADMGGIPHELGSTGFGVYHSALVAMEHVGIDVKGATIAIEGFGNVGSFAAKYLFEKGAKIVAVSDSKGMIYNKDGFDISKLEEVKRKTGAVGNYTPGEKMPNEKLFGLGADVLIPGALPDVITEKNWQQVKAKIIVEAANIPMHVDIEKRLGQKGILVVPDFVANAGGVISSYVEFIGGNAERMFEEVESRVVKNTKLSLEKAEEEKKSPRDAAMDIAVDRVKKAMSHRK